MFGHVNIYFCYVSGEQLLSFILTSVCSSVRYQRSGAWKHHFGNAQFLLHLPAPAHLYQQSILPSRGDPSAPKCPSARDFQVHFPSATPAQRVAPPEAPRVLQPGHVSACCLLPAHRVLGVPLQGPHGKQECGTAGVKRWEFDGGLPANFWVLAQGSAIPSLYFLSRWQKLPTPQKDTASWDLHPSWPSSDRIHSCPSSWVWCQSGRLWLQLWKSWKTETCSASCGDAERWGTSEMLRVLQWLSIKQQITMKVQ